MEALMVYSNIVLRKKITCASLLSASLFFSHQIFAAGYAIKEVSASLLGMAFAGASTSAIDASTIHYNPANLGLLTDNQVYLALSGILPDVDVTNASAELFGTIPIAGNPNQHDIANNALVPAGYFVWDATDKFNVALAVSAPFGLETTYDHDWVGRFHGIHSKLESVNLNPMISYNFNDHWSFAAGFQAQYLNAKLSNNVIDPIIFALFGTIAEDYVNIKGHGWGYGYNLGTIFELTDRTRFGFSYTSRLHTTLKGTAYSPGDNPFSLVLNNQDATATIKTPDRINFGIYHAFTPCFTLMVDAEWNHWSLFKDLTVKFPELGTESVTQEQWRNTWFVTAGGQAYATEKLLLRAGLAWDQSPVRNEFRTPRIPDKDRYWFTGGLSYHFTDQIRGDLSYAYVYATSSKIELEGTGDNLTLGSLNADVGAHVNIISAGINFVF